MKALFLCALFVCMPLLAKANPEWLTNMEEAKKKAAAEDKLIFINFTGSDWCGWCIKLKSEVFDTAEFKKFAADNLVLLEVDFPRKKKQPAEVMLANQKLAKEFNIDGYPTIFVINKDGKRLVQGGYVRGGPKSYIASVRKAPGFKEKSTKPGTAKPSTTPKA